MARLTGYCYVHCLRVFLLFNSLVKRCVEGTWDMAGYTRRWQTDGQQVGYPLSGLLMR